MYFLECYWIKYNGSHDYATSTIANACLKSLILILARVNSLLSVINISQYAAYAAHELSF